MEKSISTSEYRVLLDVLRNCRKESGVTQVELAESLGESQSFVSKLERGEIRIDVIQLRTIAHALGTDLPSVVSALESELQTGKRKPRRRARS